MSKETTPMQDLIEWSQNDLEIFCEDSDEALRIFKAIKDKATELLEKERQDLEDTYDKGMGARHPTGHGMSFDEYYNEKFNQA